MALVLSLLHAACYKRLIVFNSISGCVSVISYVWCASRLSVAISDVFTAQSGANHVPQRVQFQTLTIITAAELLSIRLVHMLRACAGLHAQTFGWRVPLDERLPCQLLNNA